MSYPEICAAVEMAPSTVRFQLGSLVRRGVISKTATRPVIYWTAPEWSDDDPRREDLERAFSSPEGPRGAGRSSYPPSGPVGLSYAREISVPRWPPLHLPQALATHKVPQTNEEIRAMREAFPWATDDGSEENPTLDWFDGRGEPFATTVRRNPFGHGHPEDLRRVRWFVGRMDTPFYGQRARHRHGHGPEDYERTKARNDRRRLRTGK